MVGGVRLFATHGARVFMADRDGGRLPNLTHYVASKAEASG